MVKQLSQLNLSCSFLLFDLIRACLVRTSLKNQFSKFDSHHSKLLPISHILYSIFLDLPNCKVVIFNYVLLALILCQIWLYSINFFSVCLWDLMWGLSVRVWWRIVKIVKFMICSRLTHKWTTCERLCEKHTPNTE